MPLLHWHDAHSVNHRDKWTVPDATDSGFRYGRYCGRGRGCYVGVDTAGARTVDESHRTTQSNLTLLSNAELLRIEYKRRATSDLLPFDGERFMEPKDRKARKRDCASRTLKSEARLRDQGIATSEAKPLHEPRKRNRMKPRKRDCHSNLGSETAPYLELEQESNRKGEHDDAMRRRDPVRRPTKRAKQEYVPPDGQELEAERARQLEGLKALEKSA